jgi:hypothetical protein
MPESDQRKIGAQRCAHAIWSSTPPTSSSAEVRYAG